MTLIGHKRHLFAPLRAADIDKNSIMSLPRFKSTSPIVIICAALCAVLGGATSVLATTSFDQLGSDIDAEAAGDNSGYSVAMSSDGTTVAVGAKSNDGNGDFAGHVRVFEFSGGSWSQLGSDIDAEAAGDNFGESIALSADGTTLAVGARMNDGIGMNGGHVRVFGFSGGNWNQLGSDIDAEAAYDNFGQSVCYLVRWHDSCCWWQLATTPPV